MPSRPPVSDAGGARRSDRTSIFLRSSQTAQALHEEAQPGVRADIDFARTGPRQRCCPQAQLIIAPAAQSRTKPTASSSRYSPPGVIVDSDLKIISSAARPARSSIRHGDASLNLLKMAREGLLYGLRTAIHEVHKTERVRKDGLRIKMRGRLQRDLEVQAAVPLRLPKAGIS